MNRKDFFRSCAGLSLLGVGETILNEGCISANYYAHSYFEKNNFVIKKSEFINKKNNNIREYILVMHDDLPTPICLYRYTENNYGALLMQCTHQQCELSVAGHMFSCPCHGSDFDLHGNVLNPPADKNLKTFKTTYDEENIYIHFA